MVFNLLAFNLQQYNQTALHLASKNGHSEVVRVLLEAKASVNTQTKVSYVVYLHTCTQCTV